MSGAPVKWPLEWLCNQPLHSAWCLWLDQRVWHFVHYILLLHRWWNAERHGSELRVIINMIDVCHSSFLWQCFVAARLCTFLWMPFTRCFDWRVVLQPRGMVMLRSLVFYCCRFNFLYLKGCEVNTGLWGHLYDSFASDQGWGQIGGTGSPPGIWSATPCVPPIRARRW